jgi:hypothetical protein
MATIYHQVWVNAPAAKLYEAISTVVIMPREGTLRYENGWWRPARESLVAWRPSGWPRGRDVVWCREPVLALDPESR